MCTDQRVRTDQGLGTDKIESYINMCWIYLPLGAAVFYCCTSWT